MNGAATGVTLVAITMTGGWIEEPDAGAGVRCDGSSALALDRCVLIGNRGSALFWGNRSVVNLNRCAFIDNHALRGGAALGNSSTLAINNCEFDGNTAEMGGAICCWYSSLSIANSVFSGNVAHTSAAFDCHEYCQVELQDCRFTGNETTGYNGIVTLFLACHGLFERCTFVGNNSHGSILYSEKISDTLLRNCTFQGNAATDAVVLAGHQKFTIENTIIAFNTIGPAILSYHNHVDLGCCDLHGNEGGDWVGNVAGQPGVNGNLARDPRFCDPVAGDLTLQAGSPCAPFTSPNPECDLIGAWPVGCGPTPAVETSWGAIKARFR